GGRVALPGRGLSQGVGVPLDGVPEAALHQRDGEVPPGPFDDGSGGVGGTAKVARDGVGEVHRHQQVVDVVHHRQDPFALRELAPPEQVEDGPAPLPDGLGHPVQVGGQPHLELVGAGEVRPAAQRLGQPGLRVLLLRVLEEPGEMDVRVRSGHGIPPAGQRPARLLHQAVRLVELAAMEGPNGVGRAPDGAAGRGQRRLSGGHLLLEPALEPVGEGREVHAGRVSDLTDRRGTPASYRARERRASGSRSAERRTITCTSSSTTRTPLSRRPSSTWVSASAGWWPFPFPFARPFPFTWARCPLARCPLPLPFPLACVPFAYPLPADAWRPSTETLASRTARRARRRASRRSWARRCTSNPTYSRRRPTRRAVPTSMARRGGNRPINRVMAAASSRTARTWRRRRRTRTRRRSRGPMNRSPLRGTSTQRPAWARFASASKSIFRSNSSTVEEGDALRYPKGRRNAAQIMPNPAIKSQLKPSPPRGRPRYGPLHMGWNRTVAPNIWYLKDGRGFSRNGFLHPKVRYLPLPPVVAALSTGLRREVEARDLGAAVERLGRVVQRQRGHGRGGQRLHLDPRSVGGPDPCLDPDGPGGHVRFEHEARSGDGDGMAERKEVRRPLRRHQPGHLGRLQRI